MDNSGKTTLAEDLALHFKGDYVQSMGPETKENQRDWVIEKITKSLKFKSSVKVHDRFTAFEEMIYGKVLRNGVMNFTFKSPEVKLLRTLIPTIIYCRPSNETIMNFGEREQMEGVVEKAITLIEAYDDLVSDMIYYGWNVIFYNYKTDPIDQLISTIRINNKFLGGL